tara:strand:+ start:3125 stop:4318 length:1194 start_codon:yes stop_codon:yes gene_type:complete
LNSYSQKQVIYLLDFPLSSRDFERFGIKNWIENNWKVKVFDFTRFLFPELWRKIDGDNLSIDFEGLTIFKNINEALSALNNLQNKVIFVDQIGYSSKEHKIRSIARYHGLLVKLELGSIPKVNADKSFLKLLNLIKNPIVLVKKLIIFLKNIPMKIRAIRYFPDYLVVSGTKSMLGVNYKKTSVIKAHNFDYDFLIQEKQIKSNKNRNYIVFLDEDGPYHSDYTRHEVAPFVTSENYYPVMDLGLDKIAKLLKLNLKIAAHPRSNYKNKRIKYKHPVLENKTFELIRNADVVVTHCSTSVQLAVLLKKPIIFVTTDEIQNNLYDKNYAKNIDNFATILGKKAINLNAIRKVNDLRNYLNVDDKKYEKYIENYIKTKGSPEKLAWNIVIENIERDLLL